MLNISQIDIEEFDYNKKEISSIRSFFLVEYNAKQISPSGGRF
jgi:hypothetical protein